MGWSLAMRELKKLTLEISGIGLIMYSPFATSHITRGANYLEQHYWNPSDVARHIREGTIAGFCTGSSGTYEIQAYVGVPTLGFLAQYPWLIRLALRVEDDAICIRDLYDLMDWDPRCPAEQFLAVDSGSYCVTIGSRPPESGVIGDHQEIVMCVERMPEIPQLTWQGVPFLGEEPAG